MKFKQIWNYPQIYHSKHSNILKQLIKNVQSFNRPQRRPLSAMNSTFSLINQFINFNLQFNNNSKVYLIHHVKLHDETTSILSQYNECQKGMPIALINHAIGSENSEIYPIRDILIKNGYCVILIHRRGQLDKYPSINGTFHFLNQPIDLKQIINQVQNNFNDSHIQLIGLSAGAVSNSVYLVWNSDTILKGVINVSQVHNELRFKKLPFPLNIAFKKVTNFAKKKAKHSKSFIDLENTDCFYDTFISLSKLSDFETSIDCDQKHKQFINQLPKSQIKTIQNDLPIILIDGCDDPIQDQEDAVNNVLPHFVDSLKHLMVVRHRQGSHLCFLEGYLWGKETQSNQLLECLNKLEEQQKTV